MTQKRSQNKKRTLSEKMAEHFYMVSNDIFDLLESSDLHEETTLEEASEEDQLKAASLERASRIVSDMKRRKVEIERNKRNYP